MNYGQGCLNNFNNLTDGCDRTLALKSRKKTIGENKEEEKRRKNTSWQATLAIATTDGACKPPAPSMGQLIPEPMANFSC